MIYYMYFKEFPFDIPDFNDLNDIKQKFNTKKKKIIEDQYLDDLIDKLLIYDPNERINWNEYFDHSFFKSKLYKRFSGKQFIEIIVNIETKNDNKIYLLNDGNLCELYVNPIKFNELNEHNTDMYIDGILTKFKRYFYINEKNNDNNDDSNSNNNNNDNNKKHIKYVFDHKLKRLDFMFFACENIISVKFVNVDTSLVESMTYMFSGCYELRDVDFTCFNTKNLKNIYNCFFASGGIKEINFSNFDFSNLDTSNIFNYGIVIYDKNTTPYGYINHKVICKCSENDYRELFYFLNGREMDENEYEFSSDTYNASGYETFSYNPKSNILTDDVYYY